MCLKIETVPKNKGRFSDFTVEKGRLNGRPAMSSLRARRYARARRHASERKLFPAALLLRDEDFKVSSRFRVHAFLDPTKPASRRWAAWIDSRAARAPALTVACGRAKIPCPLAIARA